MLFVLCTIAKNQGVVETQRFPNVVWHNLNYEENHLCDHPAATSRVNKPSDTLTSAHTNPNESLCLHFAKANSRVNQTNVL